MTKKILLALHNPRTLSLFNTVCKSRNYEPYSANSMDELLEQAKSDGYSRYVMDLNFGSPGIQDINPAIQLYELVKPRIADGSAKFIGISGEEDAVKLAQKIGVPSNCSSDLGFKEIIDFLRD